MSSRSLQRDHLDSIRSIFEETIAAHQRFTTSDLGVVSEVAEAIGRALMDGHRLLAFGNGGSAADAQHLASELVGRFEIERRSLPAIALTTDSSVLTGVANDYGYERVFARQIEALGGPGDVAFGISTSGRSRNVEAALAVARSRGMVTVALTGRDGGPIGAGADIHLNVAETSTARVQEVHRTILHVICSLIDRTFQAVDTP